MHGALPLRQLPGAPALELDERVVRVHAHGTKSEERRCAECRRVLGMHGCVYGSAEIEECPHRAVNELDEEPRDHVKLLYDVQQVEDQEDAARPEPRHRDEHIPVAHRSGSPVGSGADGADEAHKVDDLNQAAGEEQKQTGVACDGDAALTTTAAFNIPGIVLM